MIHTLGTEKFGLVTDELYFGFYDHLELQFSNGNGGPESPLGVHGPVTVVFRNSRKKAGHIRLWVPIK